MNRSIEGRERAAIRGGETEQVDIGKLLVALDKLQVEHTLVCQGQRCWPEFVTTTFSQRGQPGDDIHGAMRWIDKRGPGHQTNEPVFSNWACCPPVAPVVFKPIVRQFVVLMRCVKQRQEHADVEERDHEFSRLRSAV